MNITEYKMIEDLILDIKRECECGNISEDEATQQILRVLSLYIKPGDTELPSKKELGL